MMGVLYGTVLLREFQRGAMWRVEVVSAMARAVESRDTLVND